MPSATLERPPVKRLTQGGRVVRWVESNCRHTNGEWLGKPFRFLPWQKKLIYELFEIEPDTGLRRYRWAYISVPKKQGKTELAAALGLYLMIADGEPAALVPCAAASDEQADLVFNAAATMCKLSPTLSLITQMFEREILVPSLPGAKLKRVAAVAGTNDGQNIHAVICDELHEWEGARGRNVWTVLTNGTVGRRQPMVIQITTAGYDLETVCGEQYEYAKRVKSGEVDNPRYYSFIVEAPEKWPDGSLVDYRDPRVWEAANPSYGVLVSEDSIRNHLNKPEAVFRRYFLNQWTSAEQLWLPFGAWDACKSDVALDPKLPAHVGIDMGLKHDSSAVVVAQKQEGGRIVLRAKIWENPYPENHALHEGWKMDIAEAEHYLLELFAAYPKPAAEVDGRMMPGPEFSYDPHFFERSAQALEGEGLAMVEFPQSDSRMIPASQTFYELIVTGKIAHDGDAGLRRHVANVTADQKRRGWRMSKPKGSARKIDAAIAAAIGSYRAASKQQVAVSSYLETEGVAFL